MKANRSEQSRQENDSERRGLSDRRRKPTSPFSKYSIIGRRKQIRRTEDRERYLYVDRYGQRLFIVLIVIILLGLADGYFTLFFVENGAGEMNPLMNYVLMVGNKTFFVIKYLLTTLGLILLCIYKNHKSVRRVLGLICILYTIILANHILLYLLHF